MTIPSLRQPPLRSAAVFMTGGQFAFAAFVLASLTVIGFIDIRLLLQVLFTAVTLFYAVFVCFKLLLNIAGSHYRIEESDALPSITDKSLPYYGILAPMYKEPKVLRQFVESVSQLVYPADMLRVLILLEEDDTATLEAARALNLPSYFQVVVVPAGGPRTKPNACNYGYGLFKQMWQGLNFQVVIYDAEDRPEPFQLLKAVAKFRAADGRGKRPLGCVQARLEFTNPLLSIVSACYWAEYVPHFGRILRGLAKLGLPVPLGGTSNHFTSAALDAVAHGNGPVRVEGNNGLLIDLSGPWDPYNVTEDAAMGFALYLAGFLIGMIDSVTLESALTKLRQALNQRSRWLKGYAHTGLVYTRAPIRTMWQAGPFQWFGFNLLMIGTPLSLLLNPIVWGVTAAYLAGRLVGAEGFTTYVESFSSGWVYYVSMVVAIAGNGYLYLQKLVTSLSQLQYAVSKRLLFAPLWWAATSFSAYKGVGQLVNPRLRSYWAKTDHDAEEPALQASPEFALQAQEA